MTTPNLKEVIAEKKAAYEQEQRERQERMMARREQARNYAKVVTRELVARVDRYWREVSWSVTLPYEFFEFRELIALTCQEQLQESNPTALVVAESTEESVFIDDENGGTFEDTGRLLAKLTLTL